MRNHSPGPWDVTGDGFSVRRERNSEVVARTCGRVGLPPEQQMARRRANARLIAAAPDLLEAAKAVAENCEGPFGVWSKLLDAIAKAEGGAS